MYRVLEALRKQGETNEALAERLGIEVNRRPGSEKIDQTDLSRTLSDKYFRRICDGLRQWAKSHPEEWLQLLSSAREGALWDEYKDLLFISEDFWRPAHEGLAKAHREGKLDLLPEGIQFRDRLVNETWIMTGEPSVVDTAREREFATLRIKIGHRFVFWMPTSTGRELARRIIAEFRFTGELSEEQIENGLIFILGPDTLGHLLPFSISTPHGERSLGMIGTRNEASNIRLAMLPESLIVPTASWMRGIYIELMERGTTTTADGFEWTLLHPKDVLPASGESAKPV